MQRVIWMIWAVVFCVRLAALRRFWRLPTKEGANRFLATQFEPDRYARVGAGLLRRYRVALAVPFVLDGLAVALLAATGKSWYILHEQFVSLVLTVILNNVILIHFSAQARALAPPRESPPPATAVHLSLERRRLRDHSHWLVETAIVALTLFALALLAARHALRPILFGVIWLLYLQVGLLLLKQVFVGWRMTLPVRRTEDYLRWRAAWLAYHLRIFDAYRVFAGLLLLQVAVLRAFDLRWDHPVAWIPCGLEIAAFTLYGIRERRRLSIVEREIRPLELAREFPPTPIATGPFFAGGLLYFNPDNPGILARSPRGVALNLANRGTYVWGAYLAGLVLLVTRQIDR